MGRDPHAASFTGNPLGWERILGSLRVRATHGVLGDAALGWIQPPGCREPTQTSWLSRLGSLCGSVLRVLEAQPLAWEWNAVKIMRLCQFTASQKVDKGCLL